MDGNDEFIRELSGRIIRTYEEHGGINRVDLENLPSPREVVGVLGDLLKLCFPGYRGEAGPRESELPDFVGGLVGSVISRLSREVEKALRFDCRLKECDADGCEEMSLECSLKLLEMIPGFREALKQDVQAAYDGDPAAGTLEEVLVCYPFIEAIATYRIAHELYALGIPLLPRIMSEWAHGRTGIDIHPGAVIGRGFFIDHGTGVVIGETTRIGDHVKIYQGVTLGALSFPKDRDGKVVKGGKRHPTIEDHVTIYAGATILGGGTVIGEGSVIGANVWLTSSVPPNSRVTVEIDIRHEIRDRQRER